MDGGEVAPTGTLMEESFDLMAVQRNVCAEAETPASTGLSASTGVMGNRPVLLLAPLDADASHVLACQLEAAGYQFHVEGPVFAMEISTGTDAEFLRALQ